MRPRQPFLCFFTFKKAISRLRTPGHATACSRRLPDRSQSAGAPKPPRVRRPNDSIRSRLGVGTLFVPVHASSCYFRFFVSFSGASGPQCFPRRPWRRSIVFPDKHPLGGSNSSGSGGERWVRWVFTKQMIKFGSPCGIGSIWGYIGRDLDLFGTNFWCGRWKIKGIVCKLSYTAIWDI